MAFNFQFGIFFVATILMYIFLFVKIRKAGPDLHPDNSLNPLRSNFQFIRANFEKTIRNETFIDFATMTMFIGLFISLILSSVILNVVASPEMTDKFPINTIIYFVEFQTPLLVHGFLVSRCFIKSKNLRKVFIQKIKYLFSIGLP